MKKLFLTFLLSIFLLPSLVNAGTVSFDSVETENGTISLSVRSNEGFIRGFEVQIEVSGDVWWKSLDFSANLPQNAVKKYHYNPNDKILKIYVTSADTNENLISNTGIISIGNMKVLGSKNSEYEVKLKAMQTVNMNYQTVTQSLVDPISNKYNYVYMETPETPEIPEEPVSPENPQEPEKPNDKPNNNDQSTDNSGNSNKPNNGADNNSGNESNGNNSNEEKPKEETPKNPEIKNPTDEKNNNYLNTILVVVILLSIGLLIVILCFVFRKKK